MFPDVWAVDAFVNYDWFIQKKRFPFKKISFLGRFDYMGDHSDGTTYGEAGSDREGLLTITDYARKRITGGVTFSFGKPFQADLRLNYEKYFYDNNSLAKASEQDKIVVEMMVRF